MNVSTIKMPLSRGTRLRFTQILSLVLLLSLPFFATAQISVCVETNCLANDGSMFRGQYNQIPFSAPTAILVDADGNKIFFYDGSNGMDPAGWYLTDASMVGAYYNSSVAMTPPLTGWVPYRNYMCSPTITVTSGACVCPTATIAYASPLCTALTTAAVTLTGTSGGTYTSAPAGLSINATTGTINPSASTPGMYTVTYTIAAGAGCSAVIATASVIVENCILTCAGGSPTAPGSNYSISCGAFQPITAVSVSNSFSGTVTLTSLGGIAIPNTLVGLSPYIGKVIIVSVTANGNTCWGYLKVEDKQAPSIACPANVTLACDQAGILLTPGRTGQFIGATNVFSTAGGLVTGAVNGTTNECSKFEQSYVDAGTISACLGGTITRTWTLKDIWGNTSVTCNQIITVNPPPALLAALTFWH